MPGSPPPCAQHTCQRAGDVSAMRAAGRTHAVHLQCSQPLAMKKARLISSSNLVVPTVTSTDLSRRPAGAGIDGTASARVCQRAAGLAHAGPVRD
jgi:hypothetical protein